MHSNRFSRPPPVQLCVALTCLASTAALAAVRQPTGNEKARVEAMADQDVALTAVKMLLGLQHDVKALQPRPRQHDLAQGSFSPATTAGAQAFTARVVNLLVKATRSTDRYAYAGILARHYCEQSNRYQDTQSAKVLKQCIKTAGSQAFAGFKVTGEPLKAEAYLDALVSLLPAADATKYRQAFAVALGSTWVPYEYTLDGYDRSAGVHIKRTEFKTWSYRQLRFAKDYVEHHGLDPEFGQHLGGLMKTAERYRCRSASLFFMKPQAGGRSHAEMHLGPFSTQGGTEVPCNKAKAITRGPPWATQQLQQVDKDINDVHQWLVAVPESNTWEVYPARGIRRGQRQKARVYWVEEY